MYENDEEYEYDVTWPYLAERGLADAQNDLEKMQNKDYPNVRVRQAIDTALEAIKTIYDESKYRDGTYSVKVTD